MTSKSCLALGVLQQFRVIYGSMRRHFREVEERCGLSGSQMWVLQEAHRQPEIGIGQLAVHLGIHQSTCSLMVDKLVGAGLLVKTRKAGDQRRVGLCLTDRGTATLARLPGPAEGILPQALSSIPEVALKTLNINLAELIANLSECDDQAKGTLLADMVAAEARE